MAAESQTASSQAQVETKVAEEMLTETSETKAEKEKPKRTEDLCCYSQKECFLEKLKGFDFCHKHILEDKASPFKPCSFVSKSTGKKCPNPAPNLSGREKTYCLIHGRDSDLRKAVEERSKKRKRKQSEKSEANEHATVAKPTKYATKKLKTNEVDDIPRRDDTLRVDSSWHGDHESDTESLDNEIDEPLRHAGVWTAEEVTKVCRDKLLRLRSLYMSQFERLKHVFKKKRRKYILATKAQEEAGTKVAKKTVSALDNAMKSYNKRHRIDALLHKQSKERRLAAGSKGHHQIPPHQRCTHYLDGNRCVLKIIPSTKFCSKHICHDPNQVLFHPCSHVQGDDKMQCDTPVPNVLSHDKCLFHLPHDSLASDALQEKLDKAKELQIAKDKQKEEKRKLELQKKESTATIAVKVPTCPQSNIDAATASPNLSSLASDLQGGSVDSAANANSVSTKDPASTINNKTPTGNPTMIAGNSSSTTDKSVSKLNTPQVVNVLPATTQQASALEASKEKTAPPCDVPSVTNKEDKGPAMKSSTKETKQTPTTVTQRDDLGKNKQNSETTKQVSDAKEEKIADCAKDVAKIKDST